MRAVVEDISASELELRGIGECGKTLITLGEKFCRLLKVLFSVESGGGLWFCFDCVKSNNLHSTNLRSKFP